MQAAREPLALLLVLDETHTPLASPQLFRTLFGFTAAETRLALALSRGMTPVEYAADASVSIETVRTQLKQIYAKTNVDSRARLVKLIYSLWST